MQCTEIHNLIDDYLDSQLDGDVQAAMAAHLEQCASCRQRVRDEKVLREALRNIPVPAPSAGFAARALRRAAEVNSINRQSRHRRAFASGFAAAMVGVGVLLFVTGINNPDGETGVTQSQLAENGPQSSAPVEHDAQAIPQLPEVTIALLETRHVKLAFNSTEPESHVRISLALPEHVELEGYAGKREIAWYTDLKQGENVLTLPLLARNEKGGEFIARIEYGTTRQELRIKLNVGKPGLSTLDTLRSA